MTPRKFYNITIAGGGAALIWLLLSLYNKMMLISGPVICPIRNITGYPCPSCGVTRSLISLITGDITEALFINPLGILLSVLALVVVAAGGYDLLTRQQKLYRLYLQTEQWIKKPAIASFFILLVLANWYWNISKEL